MAEVQRADTSIYSNLQPNKGMSLSEMLGIQKSQYELSKLKELYPAMIAGEQARSKSAQITADIGEQTLGSTVAGRLAESERVQTEAKRAGVDANLHYQNMSKSVLGGYLSDPDFINGNSAEIVKKLSSAKEFLKNLGVNVENPEAEKMMELAKTDPKALYQNIKNGVQQAGGAASQYSTLQPTQPYQAYAAGQNPNAPPVNPNAPVAPNVQPLVPEQNVTQNIVNKNLPIYSQPVPLLYPPRQAGTPYAPGPSEAIDKEAGSAFRTGIVNRQSQLTTDRRNIDEVIKTADQLEKSILPTSGVLGAINRNVSTWLGDPTYKQLSKELANAQISNIQATGGSLDTVAGQQLAKMATGDETYPPEVIKSIAFRARADMTNLDMQATGAQNFANRFGDNNMKKFQQEWTKNADSKIFETITVGQDPNLSPIEKKMKVDKLLGITPGLSDKEQKQIRKAFNEKYQNLRKLESTGTLE